MIHALTSKHLRRPTRAERKERHAQAVKKVETQFLPASLEILETPPSPIGRAILWVILGAAGAALAWAFLAQVDIVAVAEGRIIPRGRLQSVEAAEAGIVRALHVEEGARVRTGELLLELDPTFADADAMTAQSEYRTAQLARARAEALLAYADGRNAPFAAPEGADPAAAAAEAAAVRARITALRERLAGIDERIVGASAARAGAEYMRQGLEEALPLAEDQLGARQRLMEKGLASRLLVLREQERVVSMRRDAQVRRAEERQAVAEIAMLRRERRQALEDFRAQAAAEKAEAEGIVATRAEAVEKADRRQALQNLRSPVDGVVHEIAVTTVGEVVEAGQALLTVVPSGAGDDSEELIVEALVRNRDAGFVSAGRRAIIKLEAYPFTRHGYLDGVVEHVSPDAIADEARGLVFPARIVITGSRLRDVTNPRASGVTTAAAEGAVRPARSEQASSAARTARARAGHPSASLPISPGMSAQVEIITGRRSVISYILSPIARATGEAGRER